LQVSASAGPVVSKGSNSINSERMTDCG
jgi:hypothetical protein